MVQLLKKVACLSLETSGLVVGWLGVVGSVLGCLFSIIGISNSKEIAENLYGNDSGSDLDYLEALNSYLVQFFSFYLGGSIILGLVSGLLISGTKQNRHSRILPWLIFQAIGLAFNAFSLVLSAHEMLVYKIDCATRLSCAILGFAFQFYIYWGIYSLYKQIQVKNNTTHYMISHAVPAQVAPPPYTVCVKV